MIEEEFEKAPLSLCLTVDDTLIRPSRVGLSTIMLADIVRSVAGELENRDGGQAEPVVSKPIAEVMTPTSPTSAIVVPENCAVMDINICIGRRQLW
jgi:hypothetical protein